MSTFCNLHLEHHIEIVGSTQLSGRQADRSVQHLQRRTRSYTSFLTSRASKTYGQYMGRIARGLGGS